MADYMDALFGADSSVAPESSSSPADMVAAPQVRAEAPRRAPPSDPLFGAGAGPIEAPSDSGFWGDMRRGVVGGALSMGGSMAAAGEYLAGSGGMFSAAREGMEGAAQRQFQGASPGFQTALQREFLPGGEGPSAYDSFGSFFGAVGAQAVSSLPSALLSIIPAGLAARMAAGVGATLAGQGAAAGAVSGAMAGMQVGGGAWQGISEAWRTAPAEEVRRSPLYQQFYESAQGSPEERDRMARELAARESRPYAALIAGAVGATAGALLEGPFAAQLARRELGFLQGMRVGATAEAREEGAQGMAQEGAQQAALADPTGLNREYDPMQIARQGVQGAVVGGAVGGLVGGLGGLARRPPAGAVDPSVAAAAREQFGPPAPEGTGQFGPPAPREPYGPPAPEGTGQFGPPVPTPGDAGVYGPPSPEGTGQFGPPAPVPGTRTVKRGRMTIIMPPPPAAPAPPAGIVQGGVAPPTNQFQPTHEYVEPNGTRMPVVVIELFGDSRGEVILQAQNGTRYRVPRRSPNLQPIGAAPSPPPTSPASGGVDARALMADILRRVPAHAQRIRELRAMGMNPDYIANQMKWHIDDVTTALDVLGLPPATPPAPSPPPGGLPWDQSADATPPAPPSPNPVPAAPTTPPGAAPAANVSSSTGVPLGTGAAPLAAVPPNPPSAPLADTLPPAVRKRMSEAGLSLEDITRRTGKDGRITVADVIATVEARKRATPPTESFGPPAPEGTGQFGPPAPEGTGQFGPPAPPASTPKPDASILGGGPAPGTAAQQQANKLAGPATRVGSQDIAKAVQSEAVPTAESINAREKMILALMSRTPDKRGAMLRRVAAEAQKQNTPVPEWAAEGLALADKGRGAAARGNTEAWAAWAEKHGAKEQEKIASARTGLVVSTQKRRSDALDVFGATQPSQDEIQGMIQTATAAARRKAAQQRLERLNGVDAALTKLTGKATRSERLGALRTSGDEETQLVEDLMYWLEAARKNARFVLNAPGQSELADLFYELGVVEVRTPDGLIDAQKILDAVASMRSDAQNRATTVSMTAGDGTTDDTADGDGAAAIERGVMVEGKQEVSDDTKDDGEVQSRGPSREEQTAEEVAADSEESEDDGTLDADDVSNLQRIATQIRALRKGDVKGPAIEKQIAALEAEARKLVGDGRKQVAAPQEREQLGPPVPPEIAAKRMESVKVEAKKGPRVDPAKLAELKKLKPKGGVLRRLFGYADANYERIGGKLWDAIDNAVQITAASHAVVRNRFFDPRTGRNGLFDRTVWNKVMDSVGNVQVVVLSNEDWIAAWGNEGPGAVFMPFAAKEVEQNGVPGVILMPEATANTDSRMRHETLMHEMVHAATEWAVMNNPAVRERVSKLRSLADDWLEANDPDGTLRADENISYGLQDDAEFLAMAFTNPAFQNFLKRVVLTPADRAGLGLVGRISDAFRAFVDAVRRALNIPILHMTALEGIIEIAGDKFGDTEFNMKAAAKLLRSGEKQEGFLRPMLNTSTALNALRKAASDNGTNIGDWIKSSGPIMATVRDLEMMTRKWWTRSATMDAYNPNERFNPVEVVSRGLLSQSQEAEDTIAKEFNPTLSELADSGEKEGISSLLIDSTLANAHPDVDITHAKNNHIAKSTKPQAKQSRARHPELNRRFKALKPESQKLFLRIVKMMNDAHQRLIDSTIENALDRWWDMRAEQSTDKKDPLPMPWLGDPNNPSTDLKAIRAEFEKMKQRFLTGKETNADQKAVTESIWKLIEVARERAKIEGVYVPLQRYGDFVVRWQSRASPVIEFATEAELDAEIGRSPENVKDKSRRRVVYDAQGNEVTKPDPIIEQNQIGLALGKLPSTATPDDKKQATQAGRKEAMRKTRELAIQNGGREAWRAELVTQGVSYFDSRAEANRFHGQLAAQNTDGLMPVDLRANPTNAVGLLDPSIRKLLEVVERDDNIPEKQRKMLAGVLSNALVELTPQKTLENTQIKRKGVQGASREVDRVLANYATANANLTAANRHQLDIQRGMTAMNESLRAAEKAPTTPPNRVIGMRRVIREFEARAARDVLDPLMVNNGALESIIRNTQSVAFLYYLVSPAYNLIQLLQPYMLTMPLLTGRYGTKGVRALGKAMADLGMGAVLKGGAKESARALKTFVSKAGVGQGADMFQIARANIAASSQLGADSARMLDELQKEGLVGSSSGLEVTRTLKAKNGYLGTNLAKAEAFGRAIPSSIEVINRVGSAVAAYRLARAEGKTHEQATDYARDVVAQSQADYSAANTSRFMRPSNLALRALTSPMMTFRKYAQAVYSLLGAQFYIAMKGATKAERKQARRTLAGIFATHAAMAGALGLPTEPITLALGALALALGEDEPWDLEKEIRNVAADVFGPEAAEALMRGLPRLVGADLSSRVGLDSLLFMKDVRDYQAGTLSSYVGDTILGAPGGIMQRWLSVPGLAADGEWGRAFEAAVPKGIADFARAHRIATEGVTTRRGERIDANREVPMSESIMQALGITPSAVSETYERRNAVQGANRRMSTERNTLLREWRQADAAERTRIWREEIMPWNNRLTGDLRKDRITLENLRASLREATRRSKESGGEDYLPRNRRSLAEEGRFAVVPR